MFFSDLIFSHYNYFFFQKNKQKTKSAGSARSNNGSDENRVPTTPVFSKQRSENDVRRAGFSGMHFEFFFKKSINRSILKSILLQFGSSSCSSRTSTSSQTQCARQERHQQRRRLAIVAKLAPLFSIEITLTIVHFCGIKRCSWKQQQLVFSVVFRIWSPPAFCFTKKATNIVQR